MTTATRKRATERHVEAVDWADVLNTALTVPGNLSGTYSRFHRYSLLNMTMVYAQTGRIEPIATYKRWQAMGRQVRKGSKASAIFHPVFVPARDETGAIKTVDGKRVQKLIGFALRNTVFGLSQTEGAELDMPELPEWSLTQALAALDIEQVPFEHFDGNTQGYSYGRCVAVSPVAVAPLKTMFHEIAHILLGHGADGFDYSAHRGIAEFQAESVALLAARELSIGGWDESVSRAYIQSWLAGTDYATGDSVDVADDTIKAIFSAADKIIAAGRSEHYKAS